MIYRKESVQAFKCATIFAGLIGTGDEDVEDDVVDDIEGGVTSIT